MNTNTNESLHEKIDKLHAVIDALTKKTERQQAYINSHARKIRRMQRVIYNMCGKIYDHTYEKDYIINYANYMMYNNHNDTELVYMSDSEPDTPGDE